MDIKIKKLTTIDSTNKYVKENLNAIKEWEVILAQVQTNGIGKFLRNWQSNMDGAWFSFYLKKNIHKKIQQYEILPLIIGMSIIEACLEIYNEELPLKLKWPNDVYYKNKKIAGILIEYLDGELIIGIGLNVNQNDMKEMSDIATSLFIETDMQIEIENVVKKIVEKIEYNYAMFLIEKTDEILKKIKKYNYLFDKTIFYKNQKYDHIKILNNGMLQITQSNTNKKIVITTSEFKIL